MQTLILCGGRGTRMGNDLGGIPKPLIPIGNKPILWHIMMYFAYFGFDNFVLCLGYKADEIIRYFKRERQFKIQFVQTGVETNTGGRIKQAKKFIHTDIFMATYGDGLSNVSLNGLIKFHKSHKRISTLTAVQPRINFGIVGINHQSGVVTHFDEKPVLDHWINGGFFVFNTGIFDAIQDNDILEKDTFGRLVKEKELLAFKHRGFWECMDTYKDNLRLNELWAKSDPPWAVWKRRKVNGKFLEG